MKKITKILLLFLALSLISICFACCTVETYTVVFKEGERTIITTNIAKGKSVYPAHITVSEGVTFEGWFSDEELNNQYEFDTPVQADLTLYAKFTSNLYTVKYDISKGISAAPTQESVNANGTFTVTDEIPVWIGYEFLGWSDGTNIYHASDEYTVTGTDSVVLYAQWQYKTVTVNFYDYEGEKIANSEREIPYNSDVLAPDIVLSPYFCFVLSGWTDNDKNQLSLNNITEDTHFFADYAYLPSDLDLFNFNLNNDGESYSVSKKDNVIYPQKVAIPNEYQGMPITKIGFRAFYGAFNYSGTEQLYIPGSINFVGSEAFYRCETLTKITIEEGVSKLGFYTFQNCWSLENIEIPQSLTDWGVNAFDRCEMLCAIDIIGDNSNLISVEGTIYSADNTILYTVNRRFNGEFSVPDSVNKIWHGAFNNHYFYDEEYNERGLTSIIFLGNIEEIGCEAFSGCELLTDITFNGTVKYIRGYEEAYQNTLMELYEYPPNVGEENICNGAFFRCWSLNCNIDLEGIEYIGGSAFQDCELVTSISIDNTITYIGEAAFTSSSVLASIEMKNSTLSANGKYKVTDNALIYLDEGVSSGDKLVLYAGANTQTETLTIPHGVTSIAPLSCRYISHATSLVITEGVQYIGAGAFSNSSSLIRVSLPSTLKVLDDEMDYYGVVAQYGSKRGVFTSCSSLAQIDWEGTPSITKIGTNSFNNCPLTIFRIPASVVEYGESVIYTNTLTQYIVDDGNTLFKAIDGVLLSKDGTIFYSYPASKTGEEYTVPESVITVETYAFMLCEKNLKTLTFQEGLININPGAFYECAVIQYNPMGIPTGASSGIEVINLPSTLKYIGENAFFYCLALKQINFAGSAPTFDYSDEYYMHYMLSYSASMFPWETSVTLFPELSFSVPEGEENGFYLALYKYNPAYVAYIDAEKYTTVTYNFDTLGGQTMEATQSIIIPQMPIPTKSDAYFHGWYSTDGTQEGNEWGEMVQFPYVYTDGETVNLYAKWQQERKQDGTKDIWAIQLYDYKTVEIDVDSKGIWLTYTPQTDCIVGFFTKITDWYSYCYDRTGVDINTDEKYTQCVASTSEGYILEGGKTYYIWFTNNEATTTVNIMVEVKPIQTTNALIALVRPKYD